MDFQFFFSSGRSKSVLAVGAYLFVAEDVPGVRVKDCNRHCRGGCGARLALIGLELPDICVSLTNDLRVKVHDGV